MDRLEQTFTFRLNENDGWKPSLSARDFQKLLSNITSIKVKASVGGYTFLKNFKLRTAQLIESEAEVGSNQTAPWIEQCTCPSGHTGQFCESCQVGYKRDVPFTDSFTRCVPCSCNGHSNTCDVQSGTCRGHWSLDLVSHLEFSFFISKIEKENAIVCITQLARTVKTVWKDTTATR